LKIKTKAAAYGLAGLAVAGAVIFSGTALGLLNVQTTGLLSVLLTDPPSVPDGVTAVYIAYTGVAVHPTGFGGSGWVSVAGEGTFDSMSLVNLSQTISSGAIPSLDYNQIRFTISNVSVEYMGKNYSASVNAGDIEVPIVGGLKVNASTPAATLIDIRPTVVNLGDQSQPSFTIAAGARALQMPSSEVDASTGVLGHRASLKGHGWYESFESTTSTNLTISELALSSSSFSFTATNGGSDPLVVRTVVIAPGLNGDEGIALGSVANGAAFAVRPDGSLMLLAGNPGQAEALLESAGYSMAAGSAQQFSYSGAITNIFGNKGITPGTSYYVIIMGPGTLGIETVVAS
jgi:hypothetical protein